MIYLHHGQRILTRKYFKPFVAASETPLKHCIIWCVILTSFFQVTSYRQMDPKSQTLTHILIKYFLQNNFFSTYRPNPYGMSRWRGNKLYIKSGLVSTCMFPFMCSLRGSKQGCLPYKCVKNLYNGISWKWFTAHRR